jgi:hypothetical protein
MPPDSVAMEIEKMMMHTPANTDSISSLKR